MQRSGNEGRGEDYMMMNNGDDNDEIVYFRLLSPVFIVQSPVSYSAFVSCLYCAEYEIRQRLSHWKVGSVNTNNYILS